MKDARLKTGVRQLLQNCHLDNLIVDQEVQINFGGDKDDAGNLLTEKEIDVVARFSYGGKKILLLFECEDSRSAAGVKRHYREYNNDIAAISARKDKIHVINSADRRFRSKHFKDVDFLRVCFAYGSSFPDQSYQVCLRQAKPHSFLVWNHFALTYYQNISSILGKWTKYELFKDFGLNLEGGSTFTINALELRQKGKTMYLGMIHPGLLLKIAYVVRRASERTYAYQRMLSSDRIATIRSFISSQDPQSFIPNAVIVVLDADPGIQRLVHFDANERRLTIPTAYCSAWIIDGQHRAYGFLGTRYEAWTQERHRPFDLPVIIFTHLREPLQTQTFININYFQKRIKSDLLCDLTALTKDLRHKLTWPSLIGRALNEFDNSPLRGRVKVSELHHGRPISLSSLAQYGLLETLLGFRQKSGTYAGPLFSLAPFNSRRRFAAQANGKAFEKQVQLLIRFLKGVQRNTQSTNVGADPWQNVNDYSLLKPTGINALFMVLGRILQKHPDGGVDFDLFLRPLRSASFRRDYVAKMGGGWKGFRGLANAMIRKLNRNKGRKNLLALYGKKEKV